MSSMEPKSRAKKNARSNLLLTGCIADLPDGIIRCRGTVARIAAARRRVTKVTVLFLRRQVSFRHHSI
jgi:hypothetical protein